MDSRQSLKQQLRGQTCSSCVVRRRFAEERQHGKWCHYKTNRPKIDFCHFWTRAALISDSVLPVMPMAEQSSRLYYIKPVFKSTEANRIVKPLLSSEEILS